MNSFYIPFALLWLVMGGPRAYSQGFSRLELHASDGQPFAVVLNGQPPTEVRAEHRFDELVPGSHKVEIWVGSRRAVRQTLQLAGGYQSVFEVDAGSKRPVVRLVAQHPLGVVPSQPPVDASRPPHLSTAARGDRLYTGRVGCMPPMDAGRFAQVLLQVSQPFNDPARLSAAQRALENRCLSIEQVVQLCRQFQSDRARLDFARFIYPFTHEQEWFLDVGETLVFESSREELQHFFSQQAR